MAYIEALPKDDPPDWWGTIPEWTYGDRLRKARERRQQHRDLIDIKCAIKYQIGC